MGCLSDCWGKRLRPRPPVADASHLYIMAPQLNEMGDVLEKVGRELEEAKAALKVRHG